ncbi:MAG: hypothetical protein RL701_2259 [Pseudomonadota bacterium]
MWVTPSAADGGCGRPVRLSLYTLLLGLWLSAPLAAAAQAEPAATPAEVPDTTPSSGYSARAKVAQTPPAGEPVTPAESRKLALHMGASFALAESLPGVVPVFSGVPYLIIRGASPAGSLSFYDGIPVPSLFHLALGPSMVDPELIGETRFFAGSVPARYGPHTGGVLAVAGPDPDTLAQPARTLQLSLLDTAGRLNLPTDNGALSIAWRYGNPGLVMRALPNLDATLGYYDYQVRYQSALSAHTQLTLIALGGWDRLGRPSEPSQDIDLAFQRLVARLIARIGRWELGSQLVLSYDDSKLGEELNGRAFRATETLYAQWSHPKWRIRTGAELNSAFVRLRRGPGALATTGPQGPDSWGSRTLAPDAEDFLDGQPFTPVPTRNLAGAYTEVQWLPVPEFKVELGLRADAFVAGSYLDAALAPMLRVDVYPITALDLHAAVAIANKPHTSPLPLPGLYDIALDRGVESAVQSEAGASVAVPGLGLLEATVFYNHFRDTVYLELILDCQGNTNPNATLLTQPGALRSICRNAGLPTANGDTYGLELFLKRDLTQRLSGFLSYTWSRSTAVARDGTPFTPMSDIRHLLNAVLQYDLGAGFGVGMRLHYRTGKMAVNTIFSLPRMQSEHIYYRLPEFLRLDVRLSYAFRVSFGRLEASLSFQNATFSRETINRDCFPSRSAPGYECVVDYQPYIVLPNLGLRADF